MSLDMHSIITLLYLNDFMLGVLTDWPVDFEGHWTLCLVFRSSIWPGTRWSTMEHWRGASTDQSTLTITSFFSRTSSFFCRSRTSDWFCAVRAGARSRHEMTVDCPTVQSSSLTIYSRETWPLVSTAKSYRKGWISTVSWFWFCTLLFAALILIDSCSFVWSFDG